jgi:hypothetical protein
LLKFLQAGQASPCCSNLFHSVQASPTFPTFLKPVKAFPDCSAFLQPVQASPACFCGLQNLTPACKKIFQAAQPFSKIFRLYQFAQRLVSVSSSLINFSPICSGFSSLLNLPPAC